MMRVLDPVPVLSGVHIKRDQFVIGIEDGFLEKKYNFLIVRGADGNNKVLSSDAPADIDLSIADLARAAAGAFEPNDTLSGFFERQTACFFETY